MRGKCGRHAGVAAICLFSGMAASYASAAIVQGTPPAVVPASVPAIPPGKPGLASGPVEPTAAVPGSPLPATVFPLPAHATPAPPPLIAVEGERATVAAPASKLNAPRAADAPVGPVGRMVEMPPVPEPSTGLLLCAVGLATLARRGRRRSTSGPRPCDRG